MIELIQYIAGIVSILCLGGVIYNMMVKYNKLQTLYIKEKLAHSFTQLKMRSLEIDNDEK